MSQIVPALLRPARVQRYRFFGDGPASVPRPHDAPQGHAAGDNPDRVLVFGNGIAVGWGVGTHDLALPGQLAREVSYRTGRGADVDLMAEMRWDIESAAEIVRGRELAVYDAVVVVLGASDAYRFVSPKRWAAGMVALLDALEAHTSPLSAVFIMGIQPVSTIPLFKDRPGGAADRWAEHLNQLTIAICEGRSRAHFVQPPAGIVPEPGQTGPTPDDDRYRSPERFREWARAQANALVPFLNDEVEGDGRARDARDRPQSRDRRLAAIWELGLDGSPAEKRFDDIVHRAQSLFGATGAAFTIVGAQRQWNKAVVGFEAREWPLEGSFCRVTIGHANGLVVEDAWTDDRVPGQDAPMRFYAGYPVEAADGTRVGALCVFDEEPRRKEDVDVSVLRDLALMIQRELEVIEAA